MWIHSWNNHASGGFTYLEHRVTNNCPAAYHYGDSYQMWSLARMFNPSHAAQHLGPNGVDALSDIQPLAYHNLIVGMKSEVHAYTSPRACGVVVNTASMWRPSPTPSCSSGAATATSSRRGRPRRASCFP